MLTSWEIFSATATEYGVLMSICLTGVIAGVCAWTGGGGGGGGAVLASTFGFSAISFSLFACDAISANLLDLGESWPGFGWLLFSFPRNGFFNASSPCFPTFVSSTSSLANPIFSALFLAARAAASAAMMHLCLDCQCTNPSTE
mmetsp:Transcript_8031/g.24143  ORF Transcript_8031/g.24143 Transcript_8031/m.24143 type:complete len:144 (+) Transcript_8031:487-918(+)